MFLFFFARSAVSVCYSEGPRAKSTEMRGSSRSESQKKKKGVKQQIFERGDPSAHPSPPLLTNLPRNWGNEDNKYFFFLKKGRKSAHTPKSATVSWWKITNGGPRDPEHSVTDRSLASGRKKVHAHMLARSSLSFWGGWHLHGTFKQSVWKRRSFFCCFFASSTSTLPSDCVGICFLTGRVSSREWGGQRFAHRGKRFSRHLFLHTFGNQIFTVLSLKPV